jgi:hypothetical protein
MLVVIQAANADTRVLRPFFFGVAVQASAVKKKLIKKIDCYYFN